VRSEDTHAAHDWPSEGCAEHGCNGAVLMVEAKDVTDEIIDHVIDVTDADYGDSTIDWQRVFDDRVEGIALADGRTVSLGDQYDTAAMRKIQRAVRKARTQG
jgi:hypothetical protein